MNSYFSNNKIQRLGSFAVDLNDKEMLQQLQMSEYGCLNKNIKDLFQLDNNK